MAERAPAERYHNGIDSPRFYVAGRAVQGRPYVMVHTGDRARARVGSFVAFAPDVVIVVGGNHRIDWVSSFGLREIYGLPGAYVGNPWSRGDVEIGSDVTLGRGVRVRSGVTIGHGAAVLPYAIVTQDVRPFAIVAGSPAREVGRRFDDEEVDRLLRLAWWDWPLERIRRELGPAPEEPRRSTGAARAAAERRMDRMTLDRLRRRIAQTLHRLALRFDPDPAAAEIFPAVDPARLSMGRRSYFAPIVRADAASRHRVTIGNYSSIAFDAEFLLETAALPSPRSALALGLGEGAAEHPRLRAADIVVGADCWITRGVRVHPGVTIGSGAVVAAYSVVTDDVRPYAIVAGNPARETGRRFDDETVEALLAISWWDWPEEVVRQRSAELCSADVAAFVARYRPGAR